MPSIQSIYILIEDIHLHSQVARCALDWQKGILRGYYREVRSHQCGLDSHSKIYLPNSESVQGMNFGIDPNLDPELALALRVSLEEERARQEQAQAAAGGDTAMSDAQPASGGVIPNPIPILVTQSFLI